MGEDEQKISNLWKKENFKATLTPQMLTDLLASSPSEEYLDIFCKRKFYDQSLSRYHTTPQDVLTKPAEPQPIELSFLADLYSGFNGTKMSSQQFHELNDQLQNFPAQSLARKIKNTNLNSLRSSLFKLNVHEEMMKILKKNIFRGWLMRLQQ